MTGSDLIWTNHAIERASERFGLCPDGISKLFDPRTLRFASEVGARRVVSRLGGGRDLVLILSGAPKENVVITVIDSERSGNVPTCKVGGRRKPRREKQRALDWEDID